MTWLPVVGVVVVASVFPLLVALGLDGPTGAGVLGFFLVPGWAGFRVAPRRSWLAPAGAQAVASVGTVFAGLDRLHSGVAALAWENLFFSSLCWASWGVGLLARRLRVRADQLARLATLLDAERESREQAVVAEERQRIAREVHDSVAHSVSVMVLQMGALRSTLDSSSREAATLSGLERLGRGAVQELRALVGILREAPAGSAPQPSLARVAELVADVREAGLPVELEADQVPELVPTLPRALDVSAYRVLQEALTNVLRHAGAVTTTVRVRLEDQSLLLDVHDAGVAGATPAPRDQGVGADRVGGHGLVGMRERVAMFGGSLDAGPDPAGGFRVRAVIPVRSIG
jgi:signal transduction histidine kinase